MNIERYRKKVAELISKADLERVSAKAIRRQIETLENISLKKVKSEFDQMVSEEYNRITDEVEKKKQQPQQTAAAPTINGFGLALPPTSLKSEPVAPPPSTKKRAHKQSSSDDDDDEADDSDEYSSVDEGDSKRSKVSSTKKKSSASKKKDDKSKSAKKTKKTTEKKKRAPALNEDGTPKTNALTKPQIISPILASVVGGTIGASGKPEMSRAQVVKQLWVYIKENNLQDPANKKEIICDSKMRELFGQDRLGCFEMNKYIGAHLTKIED
ncbi:hypothetical protein BGW42_000848 [Actinomortierella wolfii]|nr:hypothetical protein BGW42_000848 [Actinomortierella wolfii]